MWTRINRHRLAPLAPLASLIAVVALLSLAFAAGGRVRAAEDAQLSDEAFWHLITDFSEGGGFFRFDNFISNEALFQHVLGRLKETTKPGGVYLGVGPDQNFTYIVALRPRIAFIVDIRRQNMLEHLMYKALFELSQTRAEFLSNLFSRPRRPDFADSLGLEGMFNALEKIRPSRDMFKQTLQAIQNATKRHGFRLSPKDLERIEYIFNAFYNGGPKMDYKFASATPSQNVPSFVSLMLADDGTGTNWSFLATKTAYDRVRDMQSRNVIVPIVGDFAGPKALHAIATYVKDHGAAVSVFYISNVEYYIEPEPERWQSYRRNLAALPVDSNSIFIRWISRGSITTLEPMR